MPAVPTVKIPLAVCVILAATLRVPAADDPAKPHLVDDSIAHVLKAGQFYDLAEELGDPSEAGQDQAARLMANAKRVETEGRIASKSMRRVMVLGDWRETLDDWSDLQLELVWVWSGGGTMYYHLMWRNDAPNEVLLAGLAENLPLTGKPVNQETSLKIDDLLKKSKERLARIKAEIKRTGRKPPLPIATLVGRLEEAHLALKTQFQFAGDDVTTRLLLDRCKEPTELWE